MHMMGESRLNVSHERLFSSLTFYHIKFESSNLCATSTTRWVITKSDAPIEIPFITINNLASRKRLLRRSVQLCNLKEGLIAETSRSIYENWAVEMRSPLLDSNLRTCLQNSFYSICSHRRTNPHDHMPLLDLFYISPSPYY